MNLYLHLVSNSGESQLFNENRFKIGIIVSAEFRLKEENVTNANFVKLTDELRRQI